MKRGGGGYNDPNAACSNANIVKYFDYFKQTKAKNNYLIGLKCIMYHVATY